MSQDGGPRAMALIGAALGGAGVAVIGCRFVLFSFATSHPSARTLSTVGTILAVAGTLLVNRARQHPAGLRPRALLAGLAGAAIAAGLVIALAPRPPGPADVALIARDLPGFRVALPAGEPKAAMGVYEQGKLELGAPEEWGSATLSWEAGGPLTADELADLLPGLLGVEVAGRPTFTVGADRAATESLAIRKDKMRMVVSVWMCGQRRMSLLTGARVDPAPLHERVLASFECRPDAEREPTGPLAVLVDLPAGVGLIEANTQQLQFGGLDGAAFLFARAQQGAEKHPLLLEILEAVAAEVGDLRIEPDHDRMRGPHGLRRLWRGEGTSEGKPTRLLASAWTCKERQVAIIAVHVRPADLPEQPALELLLGARCADPGQAAPDYPQADQIFAAACAAGDQRGCAD